MKLITYIKNFFIKYSLELVPILLTITLFFDFALLSKETSKQGLTELKVISIIFLNLLCIYLLINFIRRKEFKKINLKPVIIPSLVFLGIRLLFMDYIPKWDSAEYFQAMIRTINEYNFTFESFLKSFNWFGHISMGFAFITSVLQFIDPTNLYILQTSIVALALIGIFSFYHLVDFFGKKENGKEKIILTTLFAVNPLFIASSMAYVPDYGVLVFSLATFASYFKNKKLLTFFLATILMFTKEIGALILVAFVMSQLAVSIITKEKLLKFILRILPLSVPLFLLLYYFIHKKWVFWAPDGYSVLDIRDDCRFCFGFKPYNFFENLKMFFVLNFNWLFILVILIGIFKKHFTNKSAKDNTYFNYLDLISIKAAYLSVILFFMVFILYIMPRYVVPITGLLLIIFYFYLRFSFPFSKTRLFFLKILIFLSLCQTFYTIDPVSKIVFGTFNLAGHKMLRIGTEYIGDGVAYNSQFIYIQRLVEKVVQKYEIKDGDNLYLDPYNWGTFYRNWGTFNKVKPNFYYTLDSIEKLPDEMYFLNFPFTEYGGQEKKKVETGYVPKLLNNDEILGKLKEFYNIKSSDRIRVGFYYVDVYKLVRK